MLGVGHAEHEVDHWLFAGSADALGEYARAVGEGVANWGAELPEEGTEPFFKGVVDVHVLVCAEVAGEGGRSVEVDVGLVEVWGWRGDFGVGAFVEGRGGCEGVALS